MDDAHANRPSVQRNLILGLLLALAAGAWAVLVWQSADADMDMTMASSTMGMRASLFLAIWVVMMVAMMFPPAISMILIFHEVQVAKRQRAFVLTWVFVATYLSVWALVGVAAYAGAVASEAIAARAALSPSTAARIGGIVLVAAGLYQLTPLKDLCLSKCRTPINFIMTSWRAGAAGALRMGLLHGAYCAGCCWLLFVILFPLGIMNVGAMAVVTLIILAEKTLPWPRLAPYATAFALVLYGALVIASPQFLFTFREDGSADMSAEMQMKMPGSSSESNLPLGSEVRLGESSEWERHRWEILLIVATQAALLTVLLNERRRRMSAEVQNTQRAAELAHTNRLNVADELTAIIAHELSQPLGAILANTEAAKALLKCRNPNVEELGEILSDIQRDDQRATEVIRRLRSLLRKAPFELKDDDLNEIVRNTVELLSRLATSREIDLSSETASGELRIKCDRVQLQQAVINLIMNAMDAVSALPHAKRKVNITTMRVENFAQVAVSDTGPGIPIDKTEMVFQPFFTTKPQGMGLGLSIAWTIISAHEGRIWADNQIGGAVFHIRLPLSGM
jgi:predicted metal-binding membrane protein/nitrogen-specific signal transduction histidine kinase